MRKNGLVSAKLTAFVLCMASAVFMCACLPFQPPKPSKATIEKNVRAESGLDCRLIRQIDEEKYLFEDVSRGIEFEVIVRPEKVKIDTGEGGYTGKYYYNILHAAAVYASYSEEVEKLIKKCNLTDVERNAESKDFSNIYILMDKDLSDDRIEAVNAFLRGLRDIAIKDLESGHGFYSELDNEFGFKVNMLKIDRSGDAKTMYRLKGNSAIHGWVLTADVEDSVLDLRKMDMGNQVYNTPRVEDGYDAVIRVSS